MSIRLRGISLCKHKPKTLKRFYSAPGDGHIPVSKQKYVPTTGMYPQGFSLGTTHVGIKASNTKFDDLVLIKSDRPAKAAGTFTRNVFQAAPVTVSKERLQGQGISHIGGVVINSGCANAVTGKGGIEDARAMCKAADKATGFDTSKGNRNAGGNLVMSTGVIGQRLPISRILPKIKTCADGLESTHESWLAAARAICTTDTFPKLVSREFSLPNVPGTFRMAGMAKGAGMIHPNMATLLSVICSDVSVGTEDVGSGDQKKMLKRAVKKTFNRISIDGDTSTNDTVLLMSNGAASAASIKAEGEQSSPIQVNFRDSPEAAAVYEAELTALCTDLAKLVVRDGEGATKFVTIRVRGASDIRHGERLAESIATSSLVKTALYGQDANWGRMLCALGYAHLGYEALNSRHVKPETTSLSFVQCADRLEAGLKKGDELRLLVNGEPQSVDEDLAAKMLKEEDLEILVRLRSDEEAQRLGKEDVEYWTCDFSHEYVTINGDYRT